MEQIFEMGRFRQNLARPHVDGTRHIFKPWEVEQREQRCLSKTRVNPLKGLKVIRRPFPEDGLGALDPQRSLRVDPYRCVALISTGGGKHVGHIFTVCVDCNHSILCAGRKGAEKSSLVIAGDDRQSETRESLLPQVRQIHFPVGPPAIPPLIEHARPRVATTRLPLAPTAPDGQKSCQWQGTLHAFQIAMRMLSRPAFRHDYHIDIHRTDIAGFTFEPPDRVRTIARRMDSSHFADRRRERLKFALRKVSDQQCTHIKEQMVVGGIVHCRQTSGDSIDGRYFCGTSQKRVVIFL